MLWSRSSAEIENIDVICFGHLLFEMCAGYELASPTPSKAHLQVDLERYPQVNQLNWKQTLSIASKILIFPLFFHAFVYIIEFQVVEVLQMIFESPGGYPSLEELVLCDLFRNIDLREMRGSCVPVSFLNKQPVDIPIKSYNKK